MRGKTSPESDALGVERGASMRPPQNAGENRGHPRRLGPPRRRFNEAPAECGGKQAVFGGVNQALAASMRPPQNAGENPDNAAELRAEAVLQ